MDNDRMLLEKAAKAAGLDLQWQDDKPHIGDWMSRNWWNPLTDDGDALRLAVKLGLEVDPWLGRKITIVDHGEIDCAINENHGDDPYSATRRAIVRAAAEIGKAMV